MEFTTPVDAFSFNNSLNPPIKLDEIDLTLNLPLLTSN
jgi:hypothetical protein